MKTPHAVTSQLSPEAKQNIADKLQVLDNEAVHNILNVNFENETQLREAASAWKKHVIDVMQQGHATFQMISSIDVLGEVPLKVFREKPDWAQKTLRELSLRRQRLKKIVDGYTTTEKPSRDNWKWTLPTAIAAATLVTAVIVAVVLVATFIRTSDPPATTDAAIYQAGRDIVIGESRAPLTLAREASIASMLVEVRLTSTVKPGAALPPDEVPFFPVGDSHAFLEGSAGRVQLPFQSPVRFRRLDGDRIVTTNRFFLPAASELSGRQVESIRNYETLSVPIVTVVWGSSFDTMTLLEVSMFMNGQGPIYSSWQYDVQFQQGSRFEVPLQPFTDGLLGISEQ